MGQIKPEHPELFALEFGKKLLNPTMCTLSSTNIDQSAPNLVKMYVTIRFQMSLIMDPAFALTQKMPLRRNLTGIGREKSTIRVPQDANHLSNFTADHAACKFKHANETF